MNRRIILNKPPVARTALGIEDYEIEGALAPTDELESAVQMSEQATAAQSDLNDADTLAYRADALSDLVTVAETTPEASENDLVLTEIVADLATQGTDLVTEADVVPGLESFVGKQIATEGIKETIQSMWKALMEFLKNAWQNVKAFFGNVDAQIATLKKKLKEIASSAKDGKIPASAMGKEIMAVMDDQKAYRLSGPQYIFHYLDDQKKYLSAVFSKHAQLVTKFSDEVSKAFIQSEKMLDKLLSKADFKTSGDHLKETELAAIEVHKSLLALDGMQLYGKVDFKVTGESNLSVSEQEGGIFGGKITDDKSREITSVSFIGEKLSPAVEGEAKEVAISSTEIKAYCDRLLAHLDYVDSFHKEYVPKFEKFFAIKDSDWVVKLNQLNMKNADILRGKLVADLFGMFVRYNRFAVRSMQQPFTITTSTAINVVRGHIGILSQIKSNAEVANA